MAKDASGNIYAAGGFTNAGGGNTNRIARWNAFGWSSLSNPNFIEVLDMAIDASDNLYVCGYHSSVYKRTGTSWQTVGTSISQIKTAIAVAPDGKVYISRELPCQNFICTYQIQYWSGSAWVAIGVFNGWVYDLEFVGNNLYACGAFTEVDGNAAHRIAKWNGTTWSDPGGGMDSTVWAVQKDISGNLYACGTFDNAGGNPARGIAKWNGTTWSALGHGAYAKNMDIDANGRVVIPGGHFTGPAIGDFQPHAVSRWNGSSWTGEGDELIIPNGFLGYYGMVTRGANEVFVGGEYVSSLSTSAMKWDNSVFDWYQDADSDNYGDADQRVWAANQPYGYVSPGAGFDCNDSLAGINPGAIEICNDYDDDCDGLLNEGFDTDGDGVPDCTDCAPDDPEYPREFYVDTDGDNFGAMQIDSFFFGCVPPATWNGDTIQHWALNKDDCDDSNPTIYIGAPEVCGNGIDENCNYSDDQENEYFSNFDGDNYGSYIDDGINPPQGFVFYGCEPPASVNGTPVPHWSLNNGDCDDTNAEIHPDMPENLNNGIDDNCDGCIDSVGLSLYSDFDGDGHGAFEPESYGYGYYGCAPPPLVVNGDTIPHWSLLNDDCDDTNATIYPGATEICNNGIDENCDYIDFLQYYSDFDGDGYGDYLGGYTYEGCDPPLVINGDTIPHWSLFYYDCDDTDSTVYPGAVEICGNGIVENCGGNDNIGFYSDFDGDGYGYINFGVDPPEGFFYEGCTPPDSIDGVFVPHWATNNSDCNDANPTLHGPAQYYFTDFDQDGYGRFTGSIFGTKPGLAESKGLASSTVEGDFYLGCPPLPATDSYGNPVPAWSLLNVDCNDQDANIYPGAPELCNGVDDDCSLSPPEPCMDTDSDNFPDNLDCAPNDPNLPAIFYSDFDQDGYGYYFWNSAGIRQGFSYFGCDPPAMLNGVPVPSWSTTNGDCFDDAPNFNPGNANGQIGNMLPSDDATDQPRFLNFSWSPVPGATSYQLFIWAAGDPEPQTPTINNLTYPGYSYNGASYFNYGGAYHWRIGAVAPGCYGKSQIHDFEIISPPDLVVDSLQVPPNAFSGQPITVNWFIRNAGQTGTGMGFWRDFIYLSVDTTLELFGDYYLGERINFSALTPGASYTNSATFTLPIGISGDYYLIAYTDRNSSLTETNDQNNIRVSAATEITLSPAPDLQVPSVVTPTSAFSGTPMTFSWTVTNAGEGQTVPGNFWYDNSYLSQDSVFNPANFTYLAFERSNGVVLEPDSSYTDFITLTLPQGISGTYYVYVYTDADNREFEQANESNNIGRSAAFNILLTPPPDLKVTAMTVPATTANYQTVNVSWTVKNDGASTPAGSWADRLYLSNNPALTNFNNLQPLSTFYRPNNLNPGESYTQTVPVTIPVGITGEAYFYVHTDALEQVYEFTFESNNITRSTGAIQIGTPDLRPLSLSADAGSVTAGQSLNVDFSVVNEGGGALAGNTWKDHIYLSTSPFNAFSAILLRTELIAQPLGVGETYARTLSVDIPANVPTGVYRLYIKADGQGYEGFIWEASQESDNLFEGPTLTITGQPQPDLQVLSPLTAPAAVSSGQTFTVSWQVENSAGAGTLETEWTDAVYLSTNNTLSADDLLLGTRKRMGALAAGAAYNGSLPAAVPNGLSGARYLIVKTDIEQKNNDSNPANNLLAQAIVIELTLPPDLVIPSFAAPDSGFAGQPVQLVWNVSNFGSGPTLAGNWSDKVYLSGDFNIDPYDILLHTEPRAGNLPVNTSYTVTRQVTIPINYTGSRVLIVKADDNNSVYEHTSEGNNTAMQTIVLTLPAPSDLVVADIAPPASAIAGTPVTINWTLANTGAHPATGIMKEAVFFSKDTIWDVNDPLLGVSNAGINLPPGATVNRSLTANLKGVDVGDYYTIVRTDLLDNIYETNDTNNLTRTTDVMQVDVPELFLNTLTPATLQNANELYYRVEADTLGGETLLVTLQGDSIAAANELYLRAGQTPSRVIYDYSFGTPNYGNQEVIVPALDPETYYVMAYGNTTLGNQQAVTLKAEIIDFDIRSVRTNVGGNTGPVTVRIRGAKFEPNMTVELDGDTLGGIQAFDVMYVSPTEIFARFSLSSGNPTSAWTSEGMTPGLYDVVLTKTNGEEARLEDGFTIEAGEPALLTAALQYPTEALPGQVIPMTLQFANNSNVDIPAANLSVVSLEGAPLAPTPAQLKYGFPDIQLRLTELNGPPGVIRPGAIGSIQMYTKANAPMLFKILENTEQ
jgi:hypothetical protein